MKRFALILWLILPFCAASQVQKLNSDLFYLINEPQKKTARPPLLIMLHGYGANEADLFELAKTLDPRFMTFSLRGAFPQNQGGFCWYNLTIENNGTFRYDYKQASDSKAKVLSFISQACKLYQLDSTQVFLLGFSQGAIMSYDIAASYPTKIKGVVALSGRLMDETLVLKTDWNKVARVKWFVAHGLSDNVIKVAEAEKAQAFLKEKKAIDLSFKTYEMPHSISGAELNDIRTWLSKALSAPPTSGKPK